MKNMAAKVSGVVVEKRDGVIPRPFSSQLLVLSLFCSSLPTPPTASLNSRKALPSDLPNCGNLLGPNTNSAITKMMIHPLNEGMCIDDALPVF
jgi:hypothetical protein